MELSEQKRLARWNKGFRLFVVLLLTGLSYNLPFMSITSALDQSWIYGFNVFGEMGLKAGQDYMFTYGPLGFLAFTMNVPGTSNMVFSLAFWALIQVLFLYLLLQLVFFDKSFNIKTSNLMLFALLLISAMTLSSDYYLRFLVMFLLALSWFSRDKLKYYLLTCLLVSVLLFIKFSTALTAISAIVIYLIVMFFKNRKMFFKLFGLSFIIPVLFVAGYLIYNPSLAGLMGYLKSAAEISSGYISAMSLNLNNLSLVLAIIVGVSYIVLQIYMFFLNKDFALFMLLFAGSFFMGFKHGFVRADAHHALFFIAFMTNISIMLLFIDLKQIRDDLKQRFVTKKRFSVVLCAAVLVVLFAPIIKLDVPARKVINIFNQKLSKVSSMLHPLSENSPLPEDFLEIIGQEKVNVYPEQLSLGAYNDLNLSPMPVIQSYSAYTPYLDDTTAAYYANDETAPQYIIFNINSIDFRLPLIEAPKTWEAIYSHYAAVAYTDNYMLLERISEAFVPELVQATAKTYGKTDEIDILEDKNPVRISVNMELNGLGKLAKIFFRISEVYMTAYTDDTVTAYGRIIPDNLSQGVMVSSLPTDMLDGVMMINGSDSFADVTSIQFSGPGLKYYKNEISIQMATQTNAKADYDLPSGIYSTANLTEDPIAGRTSSEEARPSAVLLINGKIPSENIQVSGDDELTVLGWVGEKTNKLEGLWVYLRIDDTFYRLNTASGPLLASTGKGETSYRYRGVSGKVALDGLASEDHELSIVFISNADAGYFESEEKIIIHVQ